MCSPTDRRIKPSISSSVAILSLQARELQVNPSSPASKSPDLMGRSSNKSNSIVSNRTNHFEEESWIYKTPVCTTRGVVHTTSLSPPPTPHKKRSVLVLSSSIDGEDLERLCIPDLSLPQQKVPSNIPLVVPLMLLKKRPFHHIMMKRHEEEESNGENVAMNAKNRKLVLPTTPTTKNSKTTDHHNNPVPLLPINSNSRSSSHHKTIMKCDHAVSA